MEPRCPADVSESCRSTRSVMHRLSLRLLVPSGNRFEALKGDRVGQYSIRINGQWRVCFAWGNDGPADVEIADYH
ncbi:type II toxin-antitoxin system RelE/ParE family toxin [Burkholderia lata]|uniref:type II toxin-antitoxin system RelE/ParE family toxin n=1 Tax=Burkholderia lata (strain ATCC 17760 / DSM 23089 / LMG 22485 / NCIMB 9086 / R18194 / 383) TaxID=482957 RepID=UPI003C6C40ED